MGEHYRAYGKVRYFGVSKTFFVYEHLFVFEQYRGAHHHEDELMADLRGIFKEYISNPE